MGVMFLILFSTGLFVGYIIFGFLPKLNSVSSKDEIVDFNSLSDHDKLSYALGIGVSSEQLDIIRDAVSPYLVFNANISKGQGDQAVVNYITENTVGSFTMDCQGSDITIFFDDQDPNIDGSEHMIVSITNLRAPAYANTVEINEFYGNAIYLNILDSLRNPRESFYEAIIEVKFKKK